MAPDKRHSFYLLQNQAERDKLATVYKGIRLILVPRYDVLTETGAWKLNILTKFDCSFETTQTNCYHGNVSCLLTQHSEANKMVLN